MSSNFRKQQNILWKKLVHKIYNYAYKHQYQEIYLSGSGLAIHICPNDKHYYSYNIFKNGDVKIIGNLPNNRIIKMVHNYHHKINHLYQNYLWNNLQTNIALYVHHHGYDAHYDSDYINIDAPRWSIRIHKNGASEQSSNKASNNLPHSAHKLVKIIQKYRGKLQPFISHNLLTPPLSPSHNNIGDTIYIGKVNDKSTIHQDIDKLAHDFGKRKEKQVKKELVNKFLRKKDNVETLQPSSNNNSYLWSIFAHKVSEYVNSSHQLLIWLKPKYIHIYANSWSNPVCTIYRNGHVAGNVPSAPKLAQLIDKYQKRKDND